MTSARTPSPATARAPELLQPDVLVVGASLGGVLAAWRAAQGGCRVVLAAAPGWIGGQLSAQAVPPDEHALIEHGGASASYLAFREAIRAHYRAQPGFLDAARLTGAGTNPGDGWVSRLCFEPVLAARWLERLLAPQWQRGTLQVLRGALPVQLVRRGPWIERVTLARHDGRSQVVRARLVIDATDTGELLRLAELPWRVGKESAAEFGEPDAPARADPLDQQPVTHVLALRRQREAGPVVEPPPRYGFWREHVLPAFGHRQFSDQLPGRHPGTSARLPFEAGHAEEAEQTAQGSGHAGRAPTLDWWRYRRIVSAAQWQPPREDVTLVNWAQNDYALHPLLDGPLATQAVREEARELSLCWLHWLQTEAPRADGGRGFPHWQPAADMLGTLDGLAQQVYVRESRRIVAQATLTQRDLLRPPEGDAPPPDSVGIGWYPLDIHPTCVSGHGVNVAAQPFTLPLGAFVPQHADNLLPACKNIGMTHLASASARVHPVEWLVGEVAGLFAAQLLQDGLLPAALAARAAGRDTLRQRLIAAGIPLHWPAALLARRTAAAPH